jgi:hypothetical protein
MGLNGRHQDRSLIQVAPMQSEVVEQQALLCTPLRLCGRYRDIPENTQATCRMHRMPLYATKWVLLPSPCADHLRTRWFKGTLRSS